MHEIVRSRDSNEQSRAARSLDARGNDNTIPLRDVGEKDHPPQVASTLVRRGPQIQRLGRLKAGKSGPAAEGLVAGDGTSTPPEEDDRLGPLRSFGLRRHPPTPRARVAPRNRPFLQYRIIGRHQHGRLWAQMQIVNPRARPITRHWLLGGPDVPLEVERFPIEWEVWQPLFENEPVRHFAEFARPGQELTDAERRKSFPSISTMLEDLEGDRPALFENHDAL